MFNLGTRYLRLVVTVGGLFLAPTMWAAHVSTHALNASKSKSPKVSETQRTRRRMRHLASGRSTISHGTVSASAGNHNASLTRASNTGASTGSRRHTYHERFFMSSFADGLTGGDITDGEDPVVR